MKIVVTEGCVCDAVEIDGKNMMDMSDEEKRSFFIEFAKKAPLDYISNFMFKIVPIIGEYEELGHCEECGNSISRHTLELDDDYSKNE